MKRLLTVLCSLVCGGLSNPAHAQTSPGAAASIRPAALLECAARTPTAPGNRTTTITTARLQPGNPMPRLPVVEPRRFTVSVVVDTVGRADPATLEVPSDLDSATVEAMRTILSAWHFSPARLSGCPIKQVVQLRVAR